jgi:SAM-dependent methyltransferase
VVTPGPSPFLPAHFERIDESEDGLFYAEPRLVTHIDDPAIAAVTAFYEQRLPEGGRILDLMSSWVSHLPVKGQYASVTGLGMNGEELARNPQLNAFVVHDLNKEPRLPFASETFDGAVVSVSVQYLIHPVEVFAEVGRVLTSGSPFLVTYSNRCFPTKAVAIWRALSDDEHGRLVAAYFLYSGMFAPAEVLDLSPHPGRSDPVFGVAAARKRGVTSDALDCSQNRKP